MNRKSHSILLLIGLTPILITLVCILLYWYVPRSTVYYIPQKQVYMKIIETVENSPLDIVLGYTPELSKSKKYDNFRFDKFMGFSGGSFIINPKENILYFNYNIWQRYDNSGKEYMDTIVPDYHLNSVKFKMIDGILYGDTLFYDEQDTLNIPKLKKEYIGIIIRDRKHVLLKASGDDEYEYIKPIVINR